MTLAQFRRMKPKYQIRLVVVCVVAVLLFVGILLGISALFSLARTQLNTKNLEGVTAGNVLHQTTFAKVLEIAGEDDPEKIYVTDSRIVYNDQGGILEFDMNFVDVKSSKEAIIWTVHLDSKKAYMRRADTESKNRSSLSYTKMTFAKYFPSLSRVNAPQFLGKLQEELPVGSGGRYIFEDRFQDNLNPQFAPYLEEGYIGYIVSPTGSVSNLPVNYTPTPGEQVPMVLSVETVNEKKSNAKRVTLNNPENRAVILFGAGPWANL